MIHQPYPIESRVELTTKTDLNYQYKFLIFLFIQILKLCGARGKRKREEIQIVDVNQQDVLAGSREMLLKGLMDDTSKRVSVSKKKGNEPTSQQRRKHQITYLAYQVRFCLTVDDIIHQQLPKSW